MASTTVIIPGRSAITGIPGNKTPQQIVSMYGSEIPSLRTMDSTATTDDNGDTRIEFRQRTGTKGDDNVAPAA